MTRPTATFRARASWPEGVPDQPLPAGGLCPDRQAERSYFKKEEDIRPFFESQLAACGVDYFDFYLMHSQSTTNYQHFRDCRAYETAFALKAEARSAMWHLVP